jgi:hypothetical protein
VPAVLGSIYLRTFVTPDIVMFRPGVHTGLAFFNSLRTVVAAVRLLTSCKDVAQPFLFRRVGLLPFGSLVNRCDNVNIT